MTYLQERLVDSIQQDRLREARIERMNSLPRTRRESSHRVAKVLSAFGRLTRRTRPAIPSNPA